MSKGFIIIEKVEVIFGNKPEQVLRKINVYPWHDEDLVLTCKASIPSIVKTLNKFLITRYLYETFCIVGMIKKACWTHYQTVSFFVKQRLDKLEHTALITELSHSIYTVYYMEHSKQKFISGKNIFFRR